MSKALRPLLLGALVASVAFAEGPPLSEADVVQAVVRENPTVKASVVDLQRAQASLRAEEGRYRPRLLLDATGTNQNTPNLNVNGGTTTQLSQALTLGAELNQAFSWGTTLALRFENKDTRLEGPLFGGSADTFTLGPGYAFTTRLSLSQPLLRGFGNDIGLAQLRSVMLDRKDQARARDEAASASLSAALQAYWELWFAQRTLGIEREARALAAAQRDEAQRKIAMGGAADVDVLASETRLAELDQAVLDAEVSMRARTLELNRLLGRPGTDGFELGAVSAPEVTAADAARTLAAAEEASYAVQTARLSLERAETTLRSAADATRPRLDVAAWVQTQGLGNQNAATGIENMATFKNVSGNVGLTFELPLSGQQHEGQLAAARLAVSAAKERVQAAVNQVRTDAGTELNALAQAQKRLELAQRSAEVAQRSAEAQEKRQRNGAATAIEVREAQESLRRARLSVERARVDAAKAQVRVAHLAGGLLVRWGVGVAAQ